MSNEEVISKNKSIRRELNYMEAWAFIEKSSEILSQSRAIGMNPQQAALAMLTGYELGLSFTGSFRVLYVSQNGQITLKPKGALALMRMSGELEKFEYEGDDTRQTVTIKRKGQPERTRTLTIEQARKAGWKSKAWEATPANMLYWRLIGWMADMEFTEYTLGLPVADDSWLDVEITSEGDVISSSEVLVPTPPIPVKQEEVKGEIITEEIPNYGYDLKSLLEAVGDAEVLAANGGAYPATNEEVNWVVGQLMLAGKWPVGKGPEKEEETDDQPDA